eukprot:m.256167 g.256167  ORF g.256167 m.256167 type:complete len:158 (+) comp34140_c0_seq1:104-577(+)
MAAKQVGQKVFDFARISSTIPGSLKGQLNTLRSQYAAAATKLAATPPTPAPVDFAAYKAKISSPGFVDEVKSVYDAVTYSYPVDVNSSAIAASEKQALATVATLVKDSQSRVVELEAALGLINAEKPLGEITTNEYLADKPELAKEIEAEIKENNFA